MHVIARSLVEEAARAHPDAAGWLRSWWVVANRARWEDLVGVRKAYAVADQVDCCLVFDARGNRYRLICRVTYANEWQRGTLLVKHFLTHAEYDRNFWRKYCK
jgi:mRNA interferase HigB